MRKWCSKHRYEVFDLYADRGISGRDIDHRPDMGRLMRDAHAEKFDIVVFWALSRFTRSVPDLYYTMQIFQEHKIGMVSHTEAFDTSSPMGRAMIGFVGVFAQLERELTGQRVGEALAVRAAQGKRTTGGVLGYDLCGKDSLTINEKEAEQVKFYFESYLIYKSLTEVAEIARNKGYTGKRGRLPTPYSIRITLTRPVYCGYNQFNGSVFKGNHDPIITIDTYNKVQGLLRKQGKKSGRPIKFKLSNIKPQV